MGEGETLMCYILTLIPPFSIQPTQYLKSKYIKFLFFVLQNETAISSHCIFSYLTPKFYSKITATDQHIYSDQNHIQIKINVMIGFSTIPKDCASLYIQTNSWKTFWVEIALKTIKEACATCTHPWNIVQMPFWLSKTIRLSAYYLI